MNALSRATCAFPCSFLSGIPSSLPFRPQPAWAFRSSGLAPWLSGPCSWWGTLGSLQLGGWGRPRFSTCGPPGPRLFLPRGRGPACTAHRAAPGGAGRASPSTASPFRPHGRWAGPAASWPRPLPAGSGSALRSGRSGGRAPGLAHAGAVPLTTLSLASLHCREAVQVHSV